MLFTGATVTSDRLDAEVGGTVDHIVAGFGYTASNALVLNTADDPQAFVKGIGVRDDGAVCATTSTAGTDAFIEGVRVSAAGKLTYEDAASDHITSGNPCVADGRVAAALS